ncbi:MAG: AIPR family protein [Acidobacteriaceae bacterium]
MDVSFIFVQAERSSSFESAKIGQFSFGVLDFFKDQPALPQNEPIKDAHSVMERIYILSSRFKRGKPVCRLYYVTTGKWIGDQNLEVRAQAAVADLKNLNIFKEVDFVPVDADALQRLYGQTKNAISREFTFAERSVIPEIPGVAEAYLGLVPAREFIHLLQDEDGEIIKSLFYDNVRDFQDFNPVNSEIKKTLESDELRRQFVLMNNGITIIAKTLRATGNRVLIEDYQIVNGCQTSHVLFSQKELLNDDSVVLPLRVIATQDEAIIGSIIKATNRQTEVREDQLLALSDFQKKIEAFFLAYPESHRLYYERRSRQYNSVTGIEKTRIVTPANLIRAYAAMLLGEPHRTTKNYASLLDQVGKNIFGKDHKLDPYYLAALALYRLEYFFRNQLLPSKYKPARYHILYAARLLLNPAPLPRANSHEMERYCADLINTFWDIEQSEALLRKAVDAVDKVAQGNFNRDHIRTLPFTESLAKQCGV